jgi:hypothetical protein
MRILFNIDFNSSVIEKIKQVIGQKYPDIIIINQYNKSFPNNSILFSRSKVGKFSPDFIQILNCKIMSNDLKNLKSRNILVSSISPLIANQFAKSINDYILSKNIRKSDLKVGLIGLGEIGSSVANKLISNNMEVYYHDITTPIHSRINSQIRRISLDLLISRCQIVSLHVRPGPTSIPLISNRELSLMMEDSILINLSDEQLIDNSCISEIEEMKVDNRYISFQNFSNNFDIKSCKDGLVIEFITKNLFSFMEGELPKGLVDYIDFPSTGDPSFWSSKMVNI